jgi:hypothetical protein
MPGITGCGEDYCHFPWDWMVLRILLKLAEYGAEGYAGSPSDGGGGG